MLPEIDSVVDDDTSPVTHIVPKSMKKGAKAMKITAEEIVIKSTESPMTR